MLLEACREYSSPHQIFQHPCYTTYSPVVPCAQHGHQFPSSSGDAPATHRDEHARRVGNPGHHGNLGLRRELHASNQQVNDQLTHAVTLELQSDLITTLDHKSQPEDDDAADEVAQYRRPAPTSSSLDSIQAGIWSMIPAVFGCMVYLICRGCGR